MRYSLLIAVAVIALWATNGCGPGDSRVETRSAISMVALATRAVNDYSREHGHMPIPENGRLPNSLIHETNYINLESELMYGMPCKLLPIDPFDQRAKVYELDIPALNHKRNGEHHALSGSILNYDMLTSDTAIVFSIGPDKKQNVNIYYIDHKNVMPYLIERTYDPSNGTESAGDIWKVSGRGL